MEQGNEKKSIHRPNTSESKSFVNHAAKIRCTWPSAQNIKLPNEPIFGFSQYIVYQ
jgi:hypothetical protein